MDPLYEILKRDLPVPQANVNSATQTTNTTPAIVVDTDAQTNNNPTEDAVEARNNMRKLLAQGNQAVSDLVQLAKTSGTPRTYEVLAGMLKTIAEMNHDLMGLHAEEQSLCTPQETTPTGNVNIEKAVFVGSTAELQELMKNHKAKLHATESQHQIPTESEDANNI